jgi:hypothetical protein
MTSYYEQMKNRKIDKDDVEAMGEGTIQVTPEILYLRTDGPSRTNQDFIRDRLGIVTIDRLMKSAKAKQRYETEKTRDIDIIDAELRTSLLTNTPYNGREGPIFSHELPDLSSRENEKMLREVATIVFNSSQVGDTIQTMADKVVVFCAWILFCSGTQSILLSDDQIMSVINTVFKTNNILYYAYHKIFTRLNSLNIQVSNRPLIHLNRFTSAGVEVDGGFNKKNYRRSIKTRKSRKLRSRR